MNSTRDFSRHHETVAMAWTSAEVTNLRVLLPAFHPTHPAPHPEHRGPGRVEQHAFSTRNHQLSDVLHRCSLVLYPLQTEERVDSIKPPMLQDQARRILLDVIHIMADLRMAEVLAGVIEHVPRDVDGKESSARLAAWKQMIQGHISATAAQVQELLRIVGFGLEGRLQKVQHPKVHGALKHVGVHVQVGSVSFDGATVDR